MTLIRGLFNNFERPTLEHKFFRVLLVINHVEQITL